MQKHVKSKLNVTSPNLPELTEFIPYLQKIWDSKHLTNNGPMHQELEDALCDYLKVPYISLFNNGTSALIAAIATSDLKGEVITTPYSFIATAHSLVWNHLTPVFVDINPHNFNINPKHIEDAITEKTSAILGVHCYGFPCDVEEINNIAKKHNLKVIYDAAHAFGVEVNNESILQAGDMSALSFHATKVFNTFEGGAVVTKNKEDKQKLDTFKNFGIQPNGDISNFGFNGKMSEICAAFGLLQLKDIEKSIQNRADIFNTYLHGLKEVDFLNTYCPDTHIKHNYSYFPITVNKNSKITRDYLFENLIKKNIYTRKYFYPLLNDVVKPNKKLPSDVLGNAQDLAHRVLCLPLSSDMTKQDAHRVITAIKELYNGFSQ